MDRYDFMGEFDERVAREHRDVAMNPPDFAAGQNDPFDASNDPLFAPMDRNTPSFSSSPFEGITNPQNAWGTPPQPQEVPKSAEDKVVDAMIDGTVFVSKSLGQFLPALFGSFRKITPYGWKATFNLYTKYGYGMVGLGFLLWVFRFFLPSITSPMSLVVLGIFMSTIGLCGSILLINPVNNWEEETGKTGTDTETWVSLGGKEEPPQPVEEPSTLFDELDALTQEPEESFDTGYDFDEEDEEEEEYVDLASQFEDFEVIEAPTQVDVSQAVEEIPEITKGTQNRTFLFEQLYKVMESITPNFQEMQTLGEGTETFNRYNDMIMNIASRNSINLEDGFYMSEVRENKFMTQIVIQAGRSFKAQVFADAIADQETKDEYGRVVDSGAFTNYSERAPETFINVVKGKPPMVTVKDIWSTKKDFFLDPSVEMPVALGVTEFGEPVVVDFAKTNTLAVAGLPRMGKTWVVESIVAQMCMFNSPNKVAFYIGDTKEEGGSSWSHMKIPHIRKIEYDDDRVLAMLREIVDVEAPRRKAMLKEFQVDKIQRIHERHPEVDVPYLYIVIDEMTNFASRMDKTVKKEFDTMLIRFATEMPFLGIRLLLIPHRMVAPSIEKNVAQNIASKFVVAGSSESIKESLGVSPREFPYKIGGQVGKLAVQDANVNGGHVTYVVSAPLAHSEDIFREVYHFMDVLWNKIDPLSDGSTSVSASNPQEEFRLF